MKKGNLKLRTACGILESCFFTLFHSSVNAVTSFIFPIIIIIIISSSSSSSSSISIIIILVTIINKTM